MIHQNSLISQARGSDYSVIRALWDAETPQHQTAMSYQQIADAARISPRTARYAVARLCQMGEIIKRPRAGGKSRNLYELHARPPVLVTIAASGVDLRKSAPLPLSTPILPKPQNTQGVQA